MRNIGVNAHGATPKRLFDGRGHPQGPVPEDPRARGDKLPNM